MAPAATQPTLNTYNLPHPSEYSEEIFLKGGVRRMANGSLVRDLITTSHKHRFTLTFNNIVVADRTLVMAAIGYLKDGTSRAYLSPRNQSYTVVLAEDGEPDWSVRTAKGGTEFRYTGTLILEEV